MAINGKISRARGITLLLTLVVLVVLAIVIVQFQADAHLYTRSSSYHLEQLQCRYAAESGIIVASHLIKEAVRKKLTSSTKPDIMEDLLAFDPNDPNSFEIVFEPNDFLEEKPPDFVILQKTIDIGSSEVTIEIHDEKGKWPMLWLLQRTFDYSVRRGKTTDEVFRRFAQDMSVERDLVNDTMKLARAIAKPLKIPKSKTIVTGRGKSRKVRNRRVSRRKRRGREKNLRKLTTTFGVNWQNTLLNDPYYAPLRDIAEDNRASFADHLGVWGHDRINLNTAPVELLENVLGPWGLTKEQAQAIVEQRKEKPIKSVGMLGKLKGMSKAQARNINHFCVVKSNTFSAHVRARVGRTQYRLSAGMFLNNKGKVERLAVIPGG